MVGVVKALKIAVAFPSNITLVGYGKCVGEAKAHGFVNHTLA